MKLPLRCPLVPPSEFFGRLLSESPMPELVRPGKGPPPAPRSSGMGCRVIGAATAKKEIFAITVNGCDTIGVIVVLIWGAAHRNGRELVGKYDGR